VCHRGVPLRLTPCYLKDIHNGIVPTYSSAQPLPAIRIDGQRITPTTTFYVDVSKGSVRKELAYHKSIGQVYAVGALSASNADVVVSSGATFTAGAGLNNSTIATGELRVRSTGVHVPVVQNTAVTFTPTLRVTPALTSLWSITPQVSSLLSPVLLPLRR
jgi:hypothetical protein